MRRCAHPESTVIEAWCAVLAVVSVGAAARPQPVPRRCSPNAPGPSVRARVGRLRRRRRPPPITAAEVAVWCEALARVVRSGSTLHTALRTTDPPPGCVGYVDDVVLAIRRGSRLGDALAGPSPSPHLDLAVTVLRACAVNGGPPAEPLDRAAATLRGRAADAAERQTQSAQARLSAIVMTVLPVGMLALLLVTSSTTRTATMTPAGATLVALGGALNFVGWRWMRSIIARVAS